MKPYSFSGKHILITGATGGIGLSLSERLLENGARLALSARSERTLKPLRNKLSESDHITTIPADLSKPGEAKLLAKKALEHLEYIDVLFNLAGVGYFSLMEDITEENLRYLFELNTFSPIMLMSELLPHMLKQGGGRIINIVSCAGRIPIPTEGVYGGSKSALAMMANTMRLEMTPKNIDIINIYPGTVDTGFEQHARREKEKPGVCRLESCGAPTKEITSKILAAAAGSAGEIWFERKARWMSAVALIWPDYVDNRLEMLRDKALGPASLMLESKKRKWRLLQVESSIACNLKCIMCPWTEDRIHVDNKGRLSQPVWEAILPHLPDVQSIDFTGGGEPLLQPNLIEWISNARSAGCETGFLTNGLLLNKRKTDQLLQAGLDWICFSIDGADKDTYEGIRIGSEFHKVCRNVSYFCQSQAAKQVKTMINFVIMSMNRDQLEDIVRLAAELGVDQVNFKQCDVIHGDHGKGFGVFASKKTKEIQKLEKTLARARKIGRKLNVNITAFPFTPEELPVCAQDPRNSMFIRYNGLVAPCINLAIGGPFTFLGQDVTMPSVHYGRLPDQGLDELWDSEKCIRYRTQFETRVRTNEEGFMQVDLSEPSLQKLKAANQAAINAMPEAPEGCRVCHYLYGI